MANESKPVKITETVLRDGHQSLAATRTRINDMIPVLEQLDDIGYNALEAWGGATFDTCLRFLNEDPWERLRTLKKYLKKTRVQMLLRGQNILGYNHYADDVVEEFVDRAVNNGMDIIRIFDALNDVRNLECAMKAAKKSGAHVQGALVYTISPYHKPENFLQVAKDLVQLGADSICIKDMSGLLAPYDAYALVSTLKSNLSVPIEVHTHYTSGMGSMTYLKAIEAGADIIDTALSPFAMGTSQPATESMIAALRGTHYDTGLSTDKLAPIAVHFKQVKKSLEKDFNINTNIPIDPEVLKFQIPGGMMSNMLNQLKEQGAADKYPELLEEMPRVRAELGYPPLVTPTSQMVGTMSVLNVKLGERYKLVPEEIRDMVRGKYGRLPGPIDPAVQQKIIGDEPIITYRPADDIKPQLAMFKQQLTEAGYPNASREDILSYALFPKVAIEFFKKVAAGETTPSPVVTKAPTAPNIATTQMQAIAANVPGTAITAPMHGKVVSIKVKDGEIVRKGQVVLVIEAMKMENVITAPADGVVKAINTSEGAKVTTGHVMMVI
ncbi:MAG: pyruvate/oxaloacetate carboxyltransferase [Deferribacteraceae bacterium]|jgi:oxaloacetate decarboxylase alpha subunit|nr:pyruvate/oxaloacetate carboxyltransferase [Deferribacteraceae bacterium]